MKILGIDPGYERLGIAVLEKKSAHEREVVLFSECFITSRTIPHHRRLRLIGDEIEKIVKEFAPAECAVETLFFSKNQKTAMQVSEARGVILYKASSLGLEVFEYKPQSIKVATTGYGRSDKKQMTSMVEKLVKIDKKIKHDDEYDAIAVGITHFASRGKI